MLEFLQHPNATFALIGVLVLTVGFAIITKAKFTTYSMVCTAVMIGLATILSFIKIYHLPQGGSITLAAMVPLLFVAFAYGPAVGMLAGFIYGVLGLILNPYILHPVQVLFDYPLPYMAMGIAALFGRKYYLGTIFALGIRLIFHIISGVVFFASYAPPNMNPLIYSILYNASYLVPDLIICLAIIGILPTARLIKQMQKS